MFAATYTGDDALDDDPRQVLRDPRRWSRTRRRAWCPTGRSGPATNTSYGYDATRTPFRIALDVCWSGDTRAKTFSQKIGTFFAGIGAANIVDGYNVNGTKTGTNKNSTFVGPAGAAGMASGQAQLVADAYTRVAADAKAASTNYYDRSWALFTVMLMTGQFREFPVALAAGLLEDRRRQR